MLMGFATNPINFKSRLSLTHRAAAFNGYRGALPAALELLYAVTVLRGRTAEKSTLPDRLSKLIPANMIL